MVFGVCLVVIVALVALLREFVTLPQDSESMDMAYQQGFDAALRQQSCFSNPYCGVVADVWADGFVAGKEVLSRQEALCR